MECLKCDADVSELIDYRAFAGQSIECPKCGNKMMFEYEETWDGEEEGNIWSLKQVEETEPTVQDVRNAIVKQLKDNGYN